MKKLLSSLICFMLLCPVGVAEQSEARLLYQGHGSLRIVTAEGKVIYIDPYAGEGYDLPADLILVTHGHHDHTAVDLIKNRNDDCRIITYKEALVDGEYKTVDLGYAIVEALQAGNNKNHDINVCVGWLVTLSDGVTVYATGDTSTTDQIAELVERDIDYAFFCCDGKYNILRLGGCRWRHTERLCVRALQSESGLFFPLSTTKVLTGLGTSRMCFETAIIIHMPARRPAQIGMKTSAAGFPVFMYTVLERDTLQSTVGGVARNSSVAKAV